MKRHVAFESDIFSSADGCTGLARFVIWLTILFQFLFPIAGAFTPAIVYAKNSVAVTASATKPETEVYTLSRGESVQSIAKKYHLTVEELRKLNQFRTFAHGFSGLQAGDELDVPAAPVTKTQQNKQTTDAQTSQNEQEQKMAGLASQAGSFLSNSPDGQAAQSLAVGMVAGAASSNLQQVLSRYGTARVQLGVDDQFSLKNSEFDLLLPLWEQQSMLFFTQGSFHRTDDRAQSNLGLGMRYFTDSWMLGGNTFLDYDLSREHSRLGVGLEYGRDYMKLSANGYQRLSNWKNSKDLEDYQERPASGWDLRAEGWIPAMPQLGGKVVYEQYYGDEVALSDKDHRQKDPHAVTVGLSYTPVPLVTVNAEQRQGTADDDETRVGLQFNFQLGMPWEHQIDSDSVAAMRTLPGSRYDLVDRNNSIVLEYRKQDLIYLKTAEQVTGSAGERKSLGVTVKSKHGVKRIDWSAGSLLAAGGSIIANSATSYDVVLPAWQSGEGAGNTYFLTAVAVDSDDNRSEPSDTVVVVKSADISVAKSTFLPDSPLKASANSTYLPADGKSSGVATLTLVDEQNHPVDVALSDITLTSKISTLPASAGGVKGTSKGLKAQPEQDATVSAFTRKSAGVYQVTVTAGTKAELLTLTPVVNKATLSAVRFYILPMAPDGGQSTFVASPKSITADNTALSTLTLTVKNASGQPLTGIAGSLSVSATDSRNAAPAAGSITVSKMTESATAGTYTATLKGLQADSWTLRPLYSGAAIGTLSDVVVLTAGSTPDGAKSAFSTSPKVIAADNTAVSTLTLTAKDTAGNAITGAASALTFELKDSSGATPAANGITVSAATESGTPGVYTATLKGTLSGAYTVRPLFNGTAVGTLSDAVVLKADATPDGSTSTFSASPSSISADNVATSTLTLTANDVNGNGIAGLASGLTLRVQDGTGATPDAGKITVSALSAGGTPGLYTATLKGFLAGKYTVTPLFSNSAIGSLSAVVTLTTGNIPDGGQSDFNTNPKIIASDNTDSSTLTLTVKDAAGNAMTGVADNLTFAVKHSSGTTPAPDKVVVDTVAETATPGTYTATLKGTVTGVYTVKPQFSGNDIGSLVDMVALKAGSVPDGGKSAFSADPASIMANNLATSTVTLVLKDSNGNPVPRSAGSLSLSVKGHNGTTPAADKVTVGVFTETATSGTYTATLKGTLADAYTLVPQFNNTAIDPLSAVVTLTTGSTPDGGQSTFVASPVSLVANNTDVSTLTLTAKDAYGNVLSGIASDLSLALKDSTGGTPAADKVTLSSLIENGSTGVYTATLKGQLAGTYTLKPQYSGGALGNLSATVTLTTDGKPDGSQSTFSATPASIVANNTDVSLLTLKAKDANGNAITGIASGLTLNVKNGSGTTPAAGDVTTGNVTEATPGVYVATLKGQLADDYTIQPQFNGAAIGSLKAVVTLNAGTTPDDTNSTFSVNPAAIAADNADSSILTLTVKDAAGNSISGVAGSLAVSVKDAGGNTPSSAQVSVSSMTETGTDGVYTATLKGTLAGTYTLKPTYGSVVIGSLSGTVTLNAGTTPDTTRSTFSASPASVVADNAATSTLTLTLRDASGNSISGQGADLTLDVKDGNNAAPAAGAVTVTSLTENGTTGVYTATLKGKVADDWTVQPKLSGGAIGALKATVTLTAGTTPDNGLSSFVVAPATIVADDVQTTTLTLTAKDANGNAISGIASSLTLVVKDSSNATPAAGQVTVGNLTEGDAGVYTTKLKGKLADTYTVQPQFSGSAMGSLAGSVTLTAGEPDTGSTTTFTAAPASVVADNTAASTLTLVLKDKFGNAIAGQSGNLTLEVKDSQNVTPASDKVTVTRLSETGSTGVYTATLKGTLAGVYTVKPLNNGSPLGTLSAGVTLTAGTTPDTTLSSFTVNPAAITADDIATTTLTLTAKDANGNAISGIASGLTLVVKDSNNATPAAGKVTVGNLTEGATGVYTTKLKGKLADTYTVTPQFNNAAMGNLSGTVTLTANTSPDGLQSTFVADPTSLVANNTDTSTLTLTAKDTYGNVISGIAASLTLELKDSTGSTPAADNVTLSGLSETGSTGVYTATLKGTLAGVYTLKPQYNGSALGSLNATVTLTAGGTPDASQSTFKALPESIVANNADVSLLTLRAKDANGNAITGIASGLTLSVKNDSGATPAASDVTLSGVVEGTPGVYIATLKGQLAGAYTVEPQFNGSAMAGLGATVTLTSGTTPDGTNSTFSVNPVAIAADNSDSSTLTLTVKDATGNAISGIAGNLAVSVKDVNDATPSTAQVSVSSMTGTGEDGVYTATLKGALAGTYTLKPTYGSVAIGTLSGTVTLNAGTTPDGTQSTFSASPKSIVADDTAVSTLSLRVNDATGNAITGLASSLTLEIKDSLNATPADGKVTLTTLTETGTSGTYTATLKGQAADTYTVVPKFNGSPLGTLSDTVTLTAGTTPDGGVSQFTAVQHSIVADGSATSTLLFTAKDTYGNQVRGLAGSLSIDVTDPQGAAPASGKITVSSVTETASAGVYSATLKGTLAGEWVVKPQLNGSPVGTLSDTVTLTASDTPDAAQSTFVASPVSIAADNNATSTLTLTLQDVNGNAMTGKAAALELTVKNSQNNVPDAEKVIVSSLVETGSTGVYTATLKGQLAEVYTVTPALSGSAIGSLNATVTLTAGTTPDNGQSAFTATPDSIEANDEQTSTLILTLRDTFGNSIRGQSGSLTLSVKDSAGQAPAAGSVTVTALTEIATQGTYTATLKGKVAGDWTVTPLFNGSDLGGLNAVVTLNAGSQPDVNLTTFTISPASIVADDATTTTLTLTAKDAFGNAISGMASGLKLTVTDSAGGTPAAGKVTVGNLTEGTAGVYTTKLRGKLADTYTVTPKYNSAAIGSLKASVTLTANATPDNGQSAFTATPSSIPANDEQTSTLILTLKDSFGNSISGQSGNLTLNVKDSAGQASAAGSVTVTALTEITTPGTYTATLKGKVANAWTVTPLLNGGAIGSLVTTVTLTAGTTPDVTQSTFTVDPVSITADDIATSTLTLTAKDAFGNAISGKASSLTLVVTNSAGIAPAAGKVTTGSLTEGSTPGVYTTKLKGKLADTYTVTPKFSGSAIGTLKGTVTLTAATTPDNLLSTLTAAPVSVAADGDKISTVTLTVKDSYGNAIGGLTDSLALALKDSGGATPAAEKVTLSSLNETGTGVYTATLKGTLAGVYTVNALFNSAALGSLSATVTLTAGTTPDGTQSTFTVDPASITADNIATSTLTLTARDAFGNAISGIASSLKLAVTNSAGQTPAADKVTVDSLTEGSTPGVYTAKLKGTLADTYTVKPRFNNNAMGSLSGSVTLTAGTTPDSARSTLKATPASITADGVKTSTVTLTVKDSYGNAIGGLTDSLALALKDSNGDVPAAESVSLSSLSETGTGVYTATLKGTLAGVYTVNALFNESAIDGLSATVTLTAGTTPDNVQSTFTVDPVSITADNVAMSTLTLTAKDAFGNPVSGIASGLSLAVTNSAGVAPAAGKVTVDSLTEGSTPGVYTAKLKGTLADTYTVKPRFNSSAMGSLSGSVTLTAGTVPDNVLSTLKAAPVSIAADGVKTSTVTLTVKDSYGNAIGGLTDSLALELKDSSDATPAAEKVTLSSLNETGTGVYTATLKGTLAGVYTLKALFNSTAIGSLSATVTLTAGTTPDGTQSTFTVDPASITADDSAMSTLTLTAKDAFGNPVSGLTSGLSLGVTNSAGLAPAAGKVTVGSLTEGSTPGVYTAKLKGTLADTYTVKPRFNSTAIGSLSQNVTLTAGTTPDSAHSTLKAAPASIAADGVITSTVTLTVKDSFGNAIGGLTDSLALALKDSSDATPAAEKVTLSSLNETGTGVYTATLKGTLAGVYTVKALFNSAVIDNLSATVALTAGTAPDGTQSTFNADPVSVGADDIATSTLTLTARDAFGNAVSGIASGLTLVVTNSAGETPAAGKITVGSLTEGDAGVYTTKLKGKLADTYTVTPNFNGSAIGTLKGTVTLTAGTTPDNVLSTLTAAPVSVTADGEKTSTLTLTVKDSYGNAIGGLTDSLALELKDSGGATPAAEKVTLSSLNETGTGVYTATLKGTLADVYTVKALFNSTAIGSLSATVTLTAGTTPDGTQSTFTVDPDTLVADNLAMSTLTLTAKDAFGNAISGIASGLSISVKDSQGNTPAANKVTWGIVSETGTPGVYTAKLKGQLAGVYTVAPQFNGGDIGNLGGTVTLTAGTPDTDGTTTFVADPASVVADGTAFSTLTLTAKDKYGNAISGLATDLELKVTNSAGTTPGSDKVTLTGLKEEGSTGIYTATLKGTLADIYTVTPLYQGTELGKLSVDVALTAGTTPDSTLSTFSADKDHIVADNATLSTLTLNIQDANGNAMTGRAADLTLEIQNSQSQTPDDGQVTLTTLTESSTPGMYTATLKGERAEVYTLTPKLSGTAIGALSATVTLTAGTTPSGVQSTFGADPLSIAADDDMISTLTLTAKDAYGNAISGIISGLTLEIKDSTGAAPQTGRVTLSDLAESGTPGVYTATLKGQLAGVYTVKPLFNGEALGNLSAAVTLTANTTPDNGLSAFAAAPKSIVADDVATSTLTLTLKDAFGNGIPGMASGLTVKVQDSAAAEPAAGVITVSSLAETATPGVYTATLRGQQAGTWTVTPQFNGTAMGSLSDTVTLTAGTPDTDTTTTFVAEPDTVSANGEETSTLTLTVRDRFGNAISGLAEDLTLDVKDSKGLAPATDNVTVTALTEDGSSGVYTATLTGTLAGTFTVRPFYRGSAMGILGDTVTLTAGTTPDVTLSAFVARPESITANGKAVSIISFYAKDSFNNAITGFADRLAVSVADSLGATPSADDVTVSDVVEVGVTGRYIATLKGTLAGDYTVKPLLDGTAVGTFSDTVTLVSGGEPDGSQSTFEVAPDTIAADNLETSTLTLVMKDANGNAISGLAGSGSLSIKVADSQGGTPSSVQVVISDPEDGATPGTYVATLKGTLAGTYTLTPQFNGGAIGSLTGTVTLKAGTTPDGTQSAFTADPVLIASDDAETSTLTLTAKDASGNSITGIAGNLTLEVKNSAGLAPAAGKVTVSSLTETGNTGVYTATLKGTLADTFTVTPLNNGTALTPLKASVTLKAGTTPDTSLSTFVASPDEIVADNAEMSTLTLTLKDANGNGIPAPDDNLTLVVKNSAGETPAAGKVTVGRLAETDSAGVYTAKLKGTLAGEYTVVPQLNGSDIGTLSDTVTLTAGEPDTGSTTTFVATPVSVTADGVDFSTLILTAKDAFGNATSGIASGLTLVVTNSAGETPAAGNVTLGSLTETGSTGVYTATLKGKLADVYTVKPLYNNSAMGTLSAVVTLTAGTLPDGTQSTFTAEPASVVADDVQMSTLTLTAKDANGNAISGIASRLTLEVKNSAGDAPAAGKVTVGTLAETGNTGVYTAKLKGTRADVYTVTPKVDGGDIGTLNDTVTLTADTQPDVVQSTLVADPVSIVANETDISTLTLTAKDAFGNAISGIATSLSLELKNSAGQTPATGKVTLSSLVETGSTGVYTATLKGTLADVYTVKALYNSSALGSLSAAVTLTAGTLPDGTQSTFKADPASVVADDIQMSTLTLVAKDAFGNAISGLESRLTLEVKNSAGDAPAAGKVTVGTLTETGNTGVYTAKLKGTRADVYTVTPKVDGGDIGTLNDTVTLTADTQPDAVQSTLVADPVSIVANDTDISTLTLTAKDTFGNAISGIAASLSLELKNSAGQAPAAGKVTLSSLTETGNTGVYTATLKGTLADVYTVKALYNSSALGSLSAAVTLTAGTMPDGTQSTFTADPASVVADDVQMSTLTLVAKDAFGNAISDLESRLTLEVKNSAGDAPAAGKVTVGTLTETGNTGVYTAKLKGTRADVYTVTPKVDGGDIGTLNDTVTLTAGTPPDGTQSTLTATPASVVANDTDSSTLTLTAKDVFGNAISGIASGLSLDIRNSAGDVPALGKVTLSSLVETGSTGVYTATLKGQLADVYTVKALYNSAALDVMTTVTLTAGTKPDGTQSAFTAAPDQVVADDVQTSTLTLTAKDAFGNAISGIAARLTLEVKNSAGEAPAAGKVTVGTLTESGTPGVYTTKLKGTLAGVYTVTPKVDGGDIGVLNDTVTLTADTRPDGTESTLTAAPLAIVADGTESSTLTLTAKDAFGNAISGIASGLALDMKNSVGDTPDAKVTLSSLVETGNTGVYTATLTGTLADVYTVTALYDNAPLGSLSATVLLKAGAPDGVKSSFNADPASIVADDAEISTLTLTLKDANGNDIRGVASGLTLTLKDSTGSAPADGKVTMSALTENGTTGVYTATLKGVLAGTYTVTPKFDGGDIGSLSDTVTLTAGEPDTNNGTTFVASPRTVVADGEASSTLTLTMKDAYGNSITGVASSLALDVKDQQGFAPVTGKVVVSALTEEGSTGVYRATLKGTLASTYIVTPLYQGEALGTLSDEVTLKAGTTPDGVNSAFIALPTTIVANNIEESTLTLIAEDVNGNPIPGIASALTLELKNSEGLEPAAGKITLTTVTENGAPGTYTARLKGVLAGEYTVIPLNKGTAIGSLNAKVTLKADTRPDGAQSTFIAAPVSIVADGTDTSTLTMTAKDAFGNVITGIASNLTLE
ncbi:invasin domain 3-containing protein, partial [Citrobacter amalonaticus]|uniref:invasin domain 3-containing protein n=1 Tax=Citrobacter amalonaticus TaxID=35703 RepID=UPI00207C34EC